MAITTRASASASSRQARNWPRTTGRAPILGAAIASGLGPASVGEMRRSPFAATTSGLRAPSPFLIGLTLIPTSRQGAAFLRMASRGPAEGKRSNRKGRFAVAGSGPNCVAWHGPPLPALHGQLGSGRGKEELGGDGGQGRNRTADAGLFRAALYQLSYLAADLILAHARPAIKPDARARDTRVRTH